MTRRLRVAMVLTQDRGGPAQMCATLAGSLAGCDDVEVRIFGSRPANAAEALGPLLEIIAAPDKRDLAGARQVREAVERWRPDVVHAQDRRAGLIVSRLFRRGGPRLLQTYHGVPEDVEEPWFSGVPGAPSPSRYTMAVLCADAVVARVLHRTVVPSRSMATFLRARLRVPAARLVHVPNGIDIGPARPPVGPVRHLLFAGLLLPRKGLADLLDAMSRPGATPADARLTIVGDGPDRARLEAMVDRGPLAGRVAFVGFRADVADWIAGCDALVLPSRMEQQPLVLLEAMAAGKQVLATRTGDVAAMLDAPGAAACLARPGDVDDMERQLRALFADPDPARTGTALAARSRETFSAEATRDAHRVLYASLTAGPAARTGRPSEGAVP